jgi:hypothetical protein
MKLENTTQLKQLISNGKFVERGKITTLQNINTWELTFMDWFRNFNEKYLVNYSLVYIETRFKSS